MTLLKRHESTFCHVGSIPPSFRLQHSLRTFTPHQLLWKSFFLPVAQKKRIYFFTFLARLKIAFFKNCSMTIYRVIFRIIFMLEKK